MHSANDMVSGSGAKLMLSVALSGEVRLRNSQRPYWASVPVAEGERRIVSGQLLKLLGRSSNFQNIGLANGCG